MKAGLARFFCAGLSLNATQRANLAMLAPMQNPPETPPAPPKQANNPLHGMTLAAIVEALHAHYGWEELARLVPIRCFQSQPSVNSSLKFLRQTPWAREKVESLYLFMLREQRRTGGKR